MARATLEAHLSITELVCEKFSMLSSSTLENTKVSFPASPWDFFKQEHFPAWALRWWPVKLNETEVPFHDHHHYICPHLATDDRNKHVMFMYEGVNGKADNDSRIASDAGK